jgi:GDPmannose 4,6-dehydratase
VIATGATRPGVQLAFERVGLDWQRHVDIDPRCFRPAEVASLCGDPSKARRISGGRHGRASRSSWR